MADAVFDRDGDRFVPTPDAASPWGEGDGSLHGGPACGLLARAIEQAVPDPALQLVRLTVDLFRAAPLAPLTVQTEAVRAGRRIVAMRASLLADGVEVSRANGLLLRRSGEPSGAAGAPPPPGPDGIETTSLTAGGGSPPPPGTRAGFHTRVQTRWVTRRVDEALPTVWFRMPIPLVGGEETTPVQRAAMLSDFGNALASRAGSGAGSLINTDVTLYLLRPPDGEWLCLQVDHLDQDAGIGVVEVAQYDQLGRYGRSVQARLANQRPGSTA